MKAGKVIKGARGQECSLRRVDSVMSRREEMDRMERKCLEKTIQITFSDIPSTRAWYYSYFMKTPACSLTRWWLQTPACTCNERKTPELKNKTSLYSSKRQLMQPLDLLVFLHSVEICSSPADNLVVLSEIDKYTFKPQNISSLRTKG